MRHGDSVSNTKIMASDTFSHDAILAAALREAKASRRLADAIREKAESLFDGLALDPKQETLVEIREALAEAAGLDAESTDMIERTLLDAEDDPGVRH